MVEPDLGEARLGGLAGFHAGEERAGAETHLRDEVAFVSGRLIDLCRAAGDHSLAWDKRVAENLAQPLWNFEIKFAGRGAQSHAAFPEDIVKKSAKLSFDLEFAVNGESKVCPAA